MNVSEAKKLFTKYTNNECSEKEIELLDAYLDSYQTEGLDISTVKNSKDKIWNNIISELEEKPVQKKKFPFKKHQLLKIAASITLLVVLTVVVKNYSTSNSSIIIDTESVTIGSKKATLTLDNGTKIALEKGKKYATKTINSNGESLKYSIIKEPTKEKIAYNYLTIPNGGQFFVTLSDGTKVWLNSATKLKYPVKFIKNEPRVVELVYGEAYFDVTSSTENNGTTFSVISKRQSIEVLGTAFNVKDYLDETATYTTLVEGKIAININKNKKILLPNQQAIVDSELNNIILKNVDVSNEISWKDGVFSFKGKTLKEVMKVLSRWYDVKVVFENTKLEETKFKGVLSKSQPIVEILNAIKSASIMDSFVVKNKVIYLK